MFKSLSALLLVALNQFNWLTFDQHFSLKKDKKYFTEYDSKKLKDEKDAKKSETKSVTKQTISRFKILQHQNTPKIGDILPPFEPIKIPTSFDVTTNFNTEIRFNHSSIKAVWFGCCRWHRI